MTFSNFSANTIHIVDDVLDYDYQQLWINVLTIGAVCAVILGAMYQQLRLVKFSTPYQFSEWFYLSMNLRRDCDPEEERFGISFGPNYFGIYGNGTAAWGKLDANGCL
jgi:hypothetical protein